MAAGKRGRKKRQPAPDEVVALTGLTRAELATMEEELEALRFEYLPNPYDVLQKMSRGVTLHEEPHLTKDETYFRLPPKLFERLQTLVAKLQRPWTRDEIRHQRWRYVRMFLDGRSALGPFTLDEAYGAAHVVCKGTAAEATSSMMRQDYLAYERSLPEAKRRPQGRRGRPWHRATPQADKVQ
jgi:hypothetical protein